MVGFMVLRLCTLPSDGAGPPAGAETAKSREKIFRVNIAVEQELAGSYGIRGTPTFIIF